MYKVVLGGGIASGKSTAAGFLRELGATVKSLDDVAADVRNTPQVIEELETCFGSQILDDNGMVIPRQLAKAAFADKESTEKLNAIMHPRIAEQARAFLDDSPVSNEYAASRNSEPVEAKPAESCAKHGEYSETVEVDEEDKGAFVVEQHPSSTEIMRVLEVPLLEKAPDLIALADETLCIVVPESIQIKRAIDRGMSKEDAERRISEQIGNDKLANIADTVVENDSTESALKEKLTVWWNSRVGSEL